MPKQLLSTRGDVSSKFGTEISLIYCYQFFGIHCHLLLQLEAEFDQKEEKHKSNIKAFFQLSHCENWWSKKHEFEY